ncbi:hypothetical protein PIB30_114299, partial [Stylosanthes scabra]|nr:hypothetical protein [Stylosanthes scabra]
PNMPSLKHLYHLLSNPQASSQKNRGPDLEHLGSLSSENFSLEIPLVLTKAKRKKSPLIEQLISWLKMIALLKKIPQLTTQKRLLRKTT